MTRVTGFKPNAIAAGRLYAAQGRVSKITLEPATGLLSGQVLGTRVYQSTAKLVNEHDGRVACRVGICSCPVQQNCKHVISLISAAENDPALRHFFIPERKIQEPTYLEMLLNRSRLHDAAARAAAARVPDWELALQGLLPAAEQQTPADVPPLALQFEARTHTPRFGQRGGESELVLYARPVVRGNKGKWVRTGIGWTQLGYLGYTRSHDAAQVGWLQDILKSHSTRSYSTSTPAWLSFNDFGGRDLWLLIHEAARHGVALVQSGTGDPVRVLPDPVTIALNVTRTADGLDVAPRLESAGRVLPAEHLGQIGHPAHGLFLVDPATAKGARTAQGGDAVVPGTITLAPLAAGTPRQLLDFALAHRRVHVPAADEDRFLTQMYPQLRRQSAIVSADESIELPETAAPVLSLLAQYGGDHRVRLHWEWHYATGSRTTSLPLRPEPGESGPRDDAAEAALLATLGEPWQDVPALGELPDHEWGAPRLAAVAVLDGLDTMVFTEDVLPRLRALPGVEVETSGDPASYREVTEAPVVKISTTETDDRDWFDLGIVITLEGQPVSFAAVFSALAAGHTRLLLPSGAHFSLDIPALHQLRDLIEEARGLDDNNDGPLRLSRFQAGLWDELAQLGIVEAQAAEWRRQVSGLLEAATAEPLAAPDTLHATLRPYQLEGFNWLNFLRTHGLGGVLADDMGLGKTLQTLALVCQAKTDDAGTPPFLVVAPTSVVGNWASEAAKFAPGLSVATVTETFSKSGLDATAFMGAADVVITSYALFRIDYESYGRHRFAGLILDEAQFVKNHQSKAYQCARKLDAPFKLAVTGTPLENNLMELWSLTSIVAPGLFPSPKRFGEFYQRPIEKNNDPALVARLRRRVRPLMLRRTKEEVIKDLPSKQEQILEVVLNPRHHKVYQTHLQRERAKILGLLEDVNKNRFTIFSSLTLLRQLSLDVTLVDEDLKGVRSSKLDVLFEQLEDVLQEGHRALIFSQFTGFLGKLRDRLTAQGVPFSYLDGTTRNRAAVVDGFKNGTDPLFLISLKAGGFGLNLTEADYVFLLDPWWNPASEAQAVDRTHRIGQRKNVMVYRMVAKDTIEEKVMALKSKKSQLFSDVMGGDGLSSGALTAADLASLFQD
ncbi:DEAD/DEAH box helicase [Specibacter cremeus]|uniref:DEAD/DEAH box helicase n=1 Tax=Specibacter cremeus TaxID=1629051 RepID=UPI000F769B9E|nr:DEAD/DEAH box helicase [Specibacter cremeus]